jgi:hypothetical protein
MLDLVHFLNGGLGPLLTVLAPMACAPEKTPKIKIEEGKAYIRKVLKRSRSYNMETGKPFRVSVLLFRDPVVPWEHLDVQDLPCPAPSKTGTSTQNFQEREH